jgi:hypothetical protein
MLGGFEKIVFIFVGIISMINFCVFKNVDILSRLHVKLNSRRSHNNAIKVWTKNMQKHKTMRLFLILWFIEIEMTLLKTFTFMWVFMSAFWSKNYFCLCIKFDWISIFKHRSKFFDPIVTFLSTFPFMESTINLQWMKRMNDSSNNY